MGYRLSHIQGENRMYSRVQKSICLIVAVCLFNMLSFATPQVHAKMIGTQTVIQKQQSIWNKTKLQDAFSDKEASALFEKMGVHPEFVQKRIDNMTPAELVYFNQQAEDLPKGSSLFGTLLGLAVLFAIIFIVTDVIGATDIYPFINSIN